MKTIAYLIVYNEEDVLRDVISHHHRQGIDIVVIDNGSTDNSLQIIKELKDSGIVLDYEYCPTNTYSWKDLIKKGFLLAEKHNPDWIIHLDANTFLENYNGPQKSLVNQIIEANDLGCNVINLKVYDFYPTEMDDPTKLDITQRMKFYTMRGSLSTQQEKVYKYYPGIITYDGHGISFPSAIQKNFYEKPIIMRHYVFRSASHGVRKLLERKNRWNEEERKHGSHIHYDGYLGYADEILVPAHKLILKDENTSWKDIISYERNSALPSEKYGINSSNYFDNLSKSNSDVCFIIGCQRSGTTMMRLILESNPFVNCYDEPTCYDYWADSDLRRTELEKKKLEGKKLFVFKTPCLTEQFNNNDGIAKELRYNKFPFSFSYSDQLLIFLVRDPRDVCLSLKKLLKNSSGNEWIDIWHEYIDNLYPKIIPNFHSKYEKDLEIIQNAKDFSFSAKVALYWKIKTNAYFEYDLMGYKLLLVLYEDLVTSSKRNLDQLCKFLNIPFASDMLKHHQLSHSFTNEQGITIGNTDTRRSIDSSAIGLYRNNMSIQEQEIILSIAGDTYKKIQKKWIQQLRNQIVYSSQ